MSRFDFCIFHRERGHFVNFSECCNIHIKLLISRGPHKNNISETFNTYFDGLIWGREKRRSSHVLSLSVNGIDCTFHRISCPPAINNAVYMVPTLVFKALHLNENSSARLDCHHVAFDRLCSRLPIHYVSLMPRAKCQFPMRYDSPHAQSRISAKKQKHVIVKLIKPTTHIHAWDTCHHPKLRLTTLIRCAKNTSFDLFSSN